MLKRKPKMSNTNFLFRKSKLILIQNLKKPKTLLKKKDFAQDSWSLRWYIWNKKV